MRLAIQKCVLLACIVMACLACKKPFTPPETSTNTRYLVVEGPISGNDSTFIRLSRSKKIDTSRTVFPESNAQVTVESDGNAVYPLTEIMPGTYAAPPLGLDALHKYRLRIRTSDSKEYLSDFIVLKNAPPIDSVGFKPLATGVLLYVNAHDDANATKYYRWEYEEDWQFHSMFNSTIYSNGVDSLKPRKVTDQIYNCFGHDHSSLITIASTVKLKQDIIFQSPLGFIPATSEKLEKRYTILVKQYALPSDAYTFWETLQKNTEKLGSIFDVLPSEVQSNIHCINNPGELVIGYMTAGNISYKRIFIDASQLPKYGAVYPYECQVDTAFIPPKPGGYDVSILVPRTSPYTPINALYLPPPNPFGLPTAYNFAVIPCVDCTIRGKRNPPPYWK